MLLLALFRGPDTYKFSIEQQIVENFECAGDKEGHIDPGKPGKHKPDEQGANGRARGSRHARYSCCGGSLFVAHHGHDVGLPRGNIHLADAKSHEKNENGQPETWHQRYENKENVGREM